MPEDVLIRAAEKLRTLEVVHYNNRATKSSPPIEETEAYQLADELEALANDEMQIDIGELSKGFEEYDQ